MSASTPPTLRRNFPLFEPDKIRTHQLLTENWTSSTIGFWKVPSSVVKYGVVAIISMLEDLPDEYHQVIDSYPTFRNRTFGLNSEHWRPDEAWTVNLLHTHPILSNQITIPEVLSRELYSEIKSIVSDRDEVGSRLGNLTQEAAQRQPPGQSQALEDERTALEMHRYVLDKLIGHLTTEVPNFKSAVVRKLDPSDILGNGEGIIGSWLGLPEDWKTSFSDEDKTLVSYAYFKSREDFFKAKCPLNESSKLVFSDQNWTADMEAEYQADKESLEQATQQATDGRGRLSADQRMTNWANFSVRSTLLSRRSL